MASELPQLRLASQLSNALFEQAAAKLVAEVQLMPYASSAIGINKAMAEMVERIYFIFKLFCPKVYAKFSEKVTHRL